MSAQIALLTPHVKDLGGFQVQRLLPAFPTKMVGPFIFFDHFGPAAFSAGQGIDVRPHPHIGLATVTYLFEGAIVHRDSLGTVQRIEPGDVNWMTAGKGIVHSERTAAEDRVAGRRLHGLQTWVALPKSHEQAEPEFSHHGKASLPQIALPGVRMRLIAGTAFGERAPTPTFSPIFYVAVEMDAGAAFDLYPEHEERGVYAVEGEIRVASERLAMHHMTVLEPWTTVRIEAETAALLILLGGTKMDGDRLIWWNFVASSRELIDEASARWRGQTFARVPGETEFIPLPEEARSAARPRSV
ncbi:MAG: pirin family protein [Betaproteobacteria bacterium]|nr:MAG: pirin family protein [Betaproteobacteria bacterium]